MDRAKVLKVLNRDDVRGRIVRDAAVLDDQMGLAITFYFTTNQRMDGFMDLVVGRLGFNDKLSILERLPYRKKYLALKSLTHIRQLQQARNRLAHDHYLHDRDEKLVSASWLKLFDDYPNSRPIGTRTTNSRLLTDALGWELRRMHRAAKPER
jgi:hypothetical protein